MPSTDTSREPWWTARRLVATGVLSSATLAGCSVDSGTDAPGRDPAAPIAPEVTPSDLAEPTSLPDEVEIVPLPDAYRQPAEAQGTLTEIDYTTTHTVAGTPESKTAVVYLPPGYDASVSYDVLYLQHGGGGSEYSWFGRPSTGGTSLRHVFDNAIGAGDIAPLIVVAPTFDTGYRSNGSGVDGFGPLVEAFREELLRDLMPLVESTYSTHAETVDEAGLIASRGHRAFGGFSMGGVTTWHMLETSLDYFEFFIPMSGDSWGVAQLGGASHAEETADMLADAVADAGYDASGFSIFAATGSEDFAVGNMDSMVAAMAAQDDVFRLTTRGFGAGNLMYYVAEDSFHDYPWGYEYIWNGLRAFPEFGS